MGRSDIKTLTGWTVTHFTALKCSLVKHPVTQLFLSNLPGPTCRHAERTQQTQSEYQRRKKREQRRRGNPPSPPRKKKKKNNNNTQDRPSADLVGWVSAPSCDALCAVISPRLHGDQLYVCASFPPNLNKEKQTYGDLPGLLGELSARLHKGGLCHSEGEE